MKHVPRQSAAEAAAGAAGTAADGVAMAVAAAGAAAMAAVAGAAALFDCGSGDLGARFGLPDGGAVAALAALARWPLR